MLLGTALSDMAYTIYRGIWKGFSVLFLVHVQRTIDYKED